MRILICIFFSALFLIANGQSNELRTDRPVISATKMNILYKGIDNPISIAVPNRSCNELYFIATNGKLIGSDCRFSIKPYKVGVTRIIVMSIKDKDTSIVDTIEFIVKPVPPPLATLCGRRRSQEIVKEEINHCKKIDLTLEGFDYSPPHIVTHFEFNIMREDCIIIRLTSTQALFSKEIIDALKDIKSGDIITFEKIKAVNPKEKQLIFDPDTYQDYYTSLPSETIHIDEIKMEIK